MVASRSRGRLAPLALALALAAAAALPEAAAHTPGAAPVDRQGSFTLAPYGQPNSSLHVNLADLGLPINAGDTLEMNWSVNNGSGPAIAFEIHAHSAAAGSTRYYNATAASLSDSWRVPDNSGFMVSFENPWSFSVNVTYDFILFAPPPDFSLLLFLFPATAGVALGWFFYVRAARSEPPGRGGDAQDGDGADPSDSPESAPSTAPPPGP